MSQQRAIFGGLLRYASVCWVFSFLGCAGNVGILHVELLGIKSMVSCVHSPWVFKRQLINQTP